MNANPPIKERSETACSVWRYKKGVISAPFHAGNPESAGRREDGGFQVAVVREKGEARHRRRSRQEKSGAIIEGAHRWPLAARSSATSDFIRAQFDVIS